MFGRDEPEVWAIVEKGTKVKKGTEATVRSVATIGTMIERLSTAKPILLYARLSAMADRRDSRRRDWAASSSFLQARVT